MKSPSNRKTQYPCGRIQSRMLSRRQALQRCANGFGAVALSALFGEELLADSRPGFSSPGASAPGHIPGPFEPRKPHFEAKAKSVIFLYMDGGPSQVDTFDPKPRLTQENGKPFGMKMEPTQFNNNGATLGSLWDFKNHGQSGIPISSLFPNIAKHADELCVVRSMVAQFSEHTNANYFLHTGLGLAGRPSMGSWFTYGLGSENQNLPGFVVINGGLIPPGGLDNFNSGFLPASYQGSIFQPKDPPVANIRPREKSIEEQSRKLSLMRSLDKYALDRYGRVDDLESAIANYELAFKMQTATPELMDFSTEPESSRKLYGLDSDYNPTKIFAQECLLARRLVERGVRFIELTCPSVGGDRWDQHGNLKDGHENNSRAVDQPIAGLISDLKSRGLLDQTLIVWAGEFGRTPFAQGSNGRDHNPFGFTIWMAGGGVKGGTTYGATDDYGYKAVENRVEVYDLHATMLHLCGIDHKRLTYRFSGRDMRLTDVHGEVIQPLLA